MHTAVGTATARDRHALTQLCTQNGGQGALHRPLILLRLEAAEMRPHVADITQIFHRLKTTERAADECSRPRRPQGRARTGKER